MVAPRTVRMLPGGRINGLPSRHARRSTGRLFAPTSPAPTFFVGGCTYAAAYVMLGLSGLNAWSGLLAVAGTAIIVLGLRKTWSRA